MPEETVINRAKRDKAEGKAPSTQAGEFVREEIEHIRGGKHGSRSTKQAIAIGLSKARRAGVALAVPRKGTTSEATRKSAERDLAKGHQAGRKTSQKRAVSALAALKRESRSAAAKSALSRQAKQAAARRRARGSVLPSQRESME